MLPCISASPIRYYFLCCQVFGAGRPEPQGDNNALKGGDNKPGSEDKYKEGIATEGNYTTERNIPGHLCAVLGRVFL